MYFLIDSFKQKTVYFTLVFLFVLSCIAYLIVESKSVGFIYLHSLPHNNFVDILFTSITFIGNGFFVIGLGLLLVFFTKTKQLGLCILFSYLLSGLLAQIVKKIIKMPRPKEFFNLLNIKIELPNAHVGFSSLPSGHTTTAFALATILCILIKNKKLQIPLFLMAVLVGYSRIYLGHHFLEDVLVGSVIGTVSGLLTVYIFSKKYFQNLIHNNKNK